jgi:hypothetical protein
MAYTEFVPIGYKDKGEQPQLESGIMKIAEPADKIVRLYLRRARLIELIKEDLPELPIEKDPDKPEPLARTAELQKVIAMSIDPTIARLSREIILLADDPVEKAA